MTAIEERIETKPPNFDLVIKGGRLTDGTGSPWLKKNIGIARGKIISVGNIPGHGDRIINAEGMIVAPGFIDMHNHSDSSILRYPDAESYITQGVTTMVVGNCGESMAPLTSTNKAILRDRIPTIVPDFDFGWNWTTLKGYYERVATQGCTLNLAPLVGQGTIRLAVKGLERTGASKDEMAQMKKLLRQSLEEGAFGMSAGLIIPPGAYTDTAELIELGSVLTKFGALFSVHIRSESYRLIEAVEEAIKIGEENGVGVQIAHHKAIGKENWGKVDQTLSIMEEARTRGVEVNCDIYPYTAAYQPVVSLLLPAWTMAGGREGMLALLKRNEARKTIQEELATGMFIGEAWLKAAGWEGVVVSLCPPKSEYEGKSLAAILKEKNRFDMPYEGFFDWITEIEGKASVNILANSEDDIRTVISNPFSTIGSDAWAISPAAGGKPNPRAYGTFPRFIRKYVREEQLFRIEEAIRKVTSLTAGKLGIRDRGIIRPGCWADIVVFDPDKITDKATYEDPHQYSAGIAYVIVNGQIVVENGRLTNARPGMILEKSF